MDKKAQGMGIVGGLFFTIGAVIGVYGYTQSNNNLIYVGIGLCVLGAVAMKFVKL